MERKLALDCEEESTLRQQLLKQCSILVLATHHGVLSHAPFALIKSIHAGVPLTWGPTANKVNLPRFWELAHCRLWQSICEVDGFRTRATVLQRSILTHNSAQNDAAVVAEHFCITVVFLESYCCFFFILNCPFSFGNSCLMKPFWQTATTRKYVQRPKAWLACIPVWTHQAAAINRESSVIRSLTSKSDPVRFKSWLLVCFAKQFLVQETFWALSV